MEAQKSIKRTEVSM